MTALSNHVSVVESTNELDECLFIWGSLVYSSRVAYRCLAMTVTDDPNRTVIWGTRVPTKVRFFAWLLCNDRLSTGANLLQKKCIAPDEVICPRCPHPTEDALHLFYGCPEAIATWDRLDIDTTPASVTNPWVARHPPHLLHNVWSDVLLVILWRLWTACNNKVFNARIDDTSAILHTIVTDLDIWRYRYKKPTARNVLTPSEAILQQG